MAGFVETTVRDIDARLTELRRELSALEAARVALTNGTRRGPGRPRKDGSMPHSKSNGGRPRGRGAGRKNQALALIREQPGITITQMAERMEIAPNYLYRVIPGLVG
jgi:transposase-like protein